MPEAYFVTEVERQLAERRRKWRPLGWLLLAGLVVGLLLAISAIALFTDNGTPRYADPVEHFKYGSIGSEPESGIPYRVWQALPRLFPEAFGKQGDYSVFGFLYETDATGARRDLPIGVSRRTVRGVDLVWLNCAVCHTGTYRKALGEPVRIVPGMPSNNLDLGRFIKFILSTATDDRLAPDRLLPAAEATGRQFGIVEKAAWKYVVLPRLHEGLVMRRARLELLMATQPDWGPGRVDTFNPYKLVQMKSSFASLSEAEQIGAADFPSIFKQRSREHMQLHWDGNNASLDERNLSAALGAGVTPKTVDHASIARVKAWLMDLEPPPSPNVPDPAAVARGKATYRATCSACHGYRDGDRYVFEGAELGKVTDIGLIGTDRRRLDSYTADFRQRQLAELFVGTPYQFKAFTKTNGYANAPLEALWLRAPYLHNGSVPTLADLLKPPTARPVTFVRGIDIIDAKNGGMLAPTCTPGKPPPDEFCFDTSKPGNGNGGHAYGTNLPASTKADLLAYLLTF